MTDHESMLAILAVLVVLLGWSVRKYYALEQRHNYLDKMHREVLREKRVLETELRERYAASKPREPEGL